ncbi:protein MALE DISCOVERER 2-like [Magnolia sinica]|uniref:protein MALE DISCOVERER 2-like n=1 Tax=Magnolia sinica TaxID=86752 RepID=UPI0026590FEC|nr:protein MALE DISCOVERER 2-like [Magnolia sinica]
MDSLRLKPKLMMLHLFLLLSFLVPNFDCCFALRSEGLALLSFRERVESDPFGALSNWNGDDLCSWFGVTCLDGRVVILNLRDLCLVGTLAPELGKLRHIRSLILHNNSFFGTIPKEIGELEELEVLDLRRNDLSGPLPPEIGSILPLGILLLSDNRLLGTMSPELHKLSMRSELYVNEGMLSDDAQEACWYRGSITRDVDEQVEDAGDRRLLQATPAPSNGRHHRNRKGEPPTSSPSPSPAPAPSPSLLPSPPISLPPTVTGFFLQPTSSPAPAPADGPPSPAPAEPTNTVPMPPSLSSPVPSPSGSAPQSEALFPQSKRHKFSWMIYVFVGLGAFILFSILSIGIIFCRNSRVVTVRPWTTGLSGQLQKAFVTGVPSLKRSELETACEDFSNIIGCSSDSTVYKGTLSSGVEIAVASTAVKSAKEWPKHSEGQFRKKIATLSKINHKNFVNLLGYCEEEVPFTRMMVFEYAPNGTLFEHLHIKESEHLDWATRVRIAMGMAYCLEYMHQLDPPIVHKYLHSTTIYLTDDYAAKISDFSFWNEKATVKTSSGEAGHPDTTSSDPESNVYSFGKILLEMMTGKLPYAENAGLIIEWTSDYLRGERSITAMMDPTLKSFQEEEARALCKVMLSCINPDRKQRPTMREVAAQLKEITAMPPDGATPRISPLWWAELEILSSSDAS